MRNAEMKRLPVGIENFKEIRTDGYYYVDKTAMIRDLLLVRGKVNLFTRPRRFGKSLNMSMLKYFFEIGCDGALFDGLEISQERALCDEYMGKFPVISVSLKSVNGIEYATARALLCSMIGQEALKFYFLLDSDQLTDLEKMMYRKLVKVDLNEPDNFDMSDDVLMGSLKTLSGLLEKHYGRKVIILIDEYDVPLAKANEQSYYEQMVILLRNMFEQALKTNDSLHFAVLTGCLRVAKESIFTGLNNLKVFSISTVRCDEYFGFTDEEVKEMLEYYDLGDRYAAVKDWYDGYRFGNVDVYCPWDVISYCDEAIDDPALQAKDYWSNTSNNDVVKHFIEKVDNGVTRGEMERLIAGETVAKEIHEELTYSNLYDSMDNIWSVLYTAGYLTQREKPDGNRYQLTIPNMEIRKIFKDQIMAMFRADVAKDGETLGAFCEALQSGNTAEVERLFTEYLGRTVSIRDTFVRKPTKENFYHGVLLGILGFKDGWYVKSNRESGNGYCDIIVEIEKEEIGIIIEVKYAENASYTAVCRDALKQIEENGYARGLKEEGYHTIYKYGIACYRKKCRAVMETETCTSG